MFKGSIPSSLRRMVREVVAGWNVDALNVGCSGNFTIERSLHDVPGLTLSGNDVNLYSCVIGQYLAGEDRPLSIKPEWEADYGWIAPSLLTPVGRAASIIVASSMFDGPRLGSPSDARPYFGAMRDGYRRQWERMHANTISKLEALPRLARFYTGDVTEWLDVIGDEPFVSFLPFWTGGYERMFANLSDVFAWKPPRYSVLDVDDLDDLIGKVTDREHWGIALVTPNPSLGDAYRSRTQTDLGGVPIHFYASHGPKRTVVPRRPADPVGIRQVTRGDRLSGNLSLRTLTVRQFEALRVRHMNRAIFAATPEASWAVCDDDRIIGAFAVQEPSVQRGAITGVTLHPSLYLLADFPVAPTDYPRLSKLIVAAALSTEAHVLYERVKNRRCRGLCTTAFSQHPTSMKYRGLLDLVHRQDHDDERFRFKLNYAAAVPAWTLAEAYAWWADRHGDTS